MMITTSMIGLADARDLPLAQVGAKAANLARLIAAGMPVPEGFVIPVSRLAELSQHGSPGWDEFGAEVLAACAAIWPCGVPSLIVRSSAFCEDQHGVSAAGLFRSVGGIASPAEVLAAIETCRTALFAEHLTQWCREQGIAPADMALALIVQRHVGGTVAGVAMSIDPVSGHDDAVVLNITEQSLEQLVQGQITPLELRINKLYGQVSGAPAQPTPQLQRFMAQAQQLLALMAQSEALFGCPQDIEWLFDPPGNWHLVQARPVTARHTTAPESSRWAVPDGFEGFRRSLAELAGGPLTPLFATAGLPALQLGYTFALNEWSAGLVLKDDLFTIINGYLYMRNSFPRGTKLRVATLLPRAFNKLVLYERSQFAAEAARYEAAVQELAHRDVAQLSDYDLLLLTEQLMALAGRYYFYLQFSILAGSYISETASRWLLGRLLADRGTAVQADILFQGLWLGAATNADQQQLLSFLGACQMVDLDFHEAGLEGQQAAPSMDHDLAAERLELEAEIDRRHPLRSKPLQFILRRAQLRARLREIGLARLGIAWGPARLAVMELARRLTERDVIAQPDDLFFMTRQEIRAALYAPGSAMASAALISWRRAAHTALRAMSTPYYLPQTSDLKAKVRLHRLPVGGRSHLNRADVVHGVGVSRGQVTGRVLVAHSVADVVGHNAGAEPLILVTSLVTPGWTPVFSRIAGLVTDIGGTLSHSSILVREYKLPAVMGTGDATKRLKTGQVVEVDGSNGIVQLREG